jgi:hypothetical protein
MFEWVKAEQSTTIAMQYSTGCEHFSVDQSSARQKPMEKPAMAVGPFHHRSDTKAPIQHFLRFILSFGHFGFLRPTRELQA